MKVKLKKVKQQKLWLNDKIESQKINKKIKEKIQNQKNKDWN
jgi:hypothetical protein